MTEVTDSNFEAEVLKSEMPVVVFFHTPSVSPCRMIEPIVSEIEDSCRGSVKFVKLEIEENYKVSSRYGVRSVPTLIKFEKGEKKQQTRKEIGGSKSNIISDLRL